MVSFLEGPLRKAIAQGFRGKLKIGTLSRSTASVLDAYGDPLPSGEETYPFEGFVEGFSLYSRSQAGIPDADAKISIIGGSLPDGIVPQQDDRIEIGGQRFNTVRLISVDPAGALYETQATELRDG